MTRNNFPIYLTIFDIADLCRVPSWTIEKMIRCKHCPEWHWTEGMKLPRFHPSTIPEWLRLLEETNVNELPETPPPLERPSQVFEHHNGPSEAELHKCRKLLGLPADYDKAS